MPIGYSMPNVAITSVEFRNFKALKHFSLSLQEMNVLVGPNNCGKSTVISSFRLLGEALRRARTRTPGLVDVGGRERQGYRIPNDQIPISLENVHTDYSDAPSSVVYRLSNGNHLELHFPQEGGCYLVPTTVKKPVRNTTDFKREFPITIAVVPVLGPLEHDETLLDEETVRRSLNTHRASRHFRNYWHYNPDGFDAFSELVRRTWPGMTLERPQRVDSTSRSLVMFAREDRILRELYWAGFGFQVWCQLLTHISRAALSSLLLVDEPEIYLHPEVQRQLLSILRDSGAVIVMATHSAEIVGEADPSEILLVDKSKRAAQRLRDVSGVQVALQLMGSLHNITLTQLARTRKVLFVEGRSDFKILRRFARLLELVELAGGTGIIAVETGGFTTWEKVAATAWGIERTLGTSLQLAAVFDRDYLPDEERVVVLTELQQHLRLAHIHARKEIENYLLEPAVLQRALETEVRQKSRHGAASIVAPTAVRDLLRDITDVMRSEVQGQYIAKRAVFLAGSRSDPATTTAETIRWFDDRWNVLEERMKIVPGKEVIHALRDQVQHRWKVNLTDIRIVDAFRLEDIDPDLASLVRQLEAFRAS